MADTPNATVAALATSLLEAQRTRDGLLNEWLDGAANGGPNADGRYPLPAPGGTRLVPCWAAITAPITGSAATAAHDAQRAADAKAAAETAQLTIATIHAAIDQKLAEARSLKTGTELLRQQAASEHAAARAERAACQQLKADMQAMLDAWSAAHP